MTIAAGSPPPRRGLLLAAIAAAALVVVSIARVRARVDADEPPAPAPVASASGYVGSDACAPCHGTEHRAWKDTLHSRMEQPATPDTVIGRFTPEGTGVPTEAEGKRIVMIREGDAFFVEAPDADGEAKRFRVERTIGNRYKQRYLTRFPDGSWRALPVQWFARDGTFVEWHHKASVKPGSGDFWADDAWQWQLKCAGCHVTGLDLGYDPAKKAYETRWTEMAVGCEACHGPGEAHVKAKGGRDNVLCPSRMTHSQQLDVCGRCHSRGTAGPEQGAPAGLPARLAYPHAFVPGSRLADSYVQVTPEKNPAEFWKDGSSRNHHQQWTDYQGSPMLHRGGERSPTCTTCHDPHRADALRATIDDNRLCMSCHRAFREPGALAAHAGHGDNPRANPGARCVECHMPRVVDHAGSFRLRSHTFRAPNPRVARETGTPDACLLCHRDRDAAWSEAKAAALWPRLAAPK